MDDLILDLLKLNNIDFRLENDKLILKLSEGRNKLDIISIVHNAMLAVTGDIMLGVAVFEDELSNSKKDN